MKKRFLLIAAFVASLALNAHEAAIDIDSSVKFQHVSGFGGFSPSPQWSYWLGDAQMDMLFGTGEDQLGLNILRTYISPDPNGWYSSIANTKRAKKYGAFVFASPWSPPAKWKSNNSDSNGGYLLEEHYKDWATQLNNYYLFTKEQGCGIDAVSIQNEPDWNASYQSCIWTGEQMADFLKKYGKLIQCKIIAPEAIHFSREMHEPILNDPDACAQLDIMGGHFYGWDGSSYPLAAAKGKEVWMTEYLINERQNNSHLNINWKDDGFLFARSVNDAMLANMSAWVHYSLKRFYGCLGDGEYGTQNNKITKRGYVLSHYAKYVSGATRLRHALTDETNNLTSSVYLSEDGNRVIVMVINPSDQNYQTTITLPFYTISAQEIRTSEIEDIAKSDLEWEDETYAPVVNIEPYTVNTYIFTKSSERTDLPIIEEGDVSVFTDQFDLYGASCIPQGWQAKSEEGVRHSGNYTLGPRVMSFSPEGKMTHAFYFRTGSSVGYVSYGQENDYRLYLEPGSYSISFSTVGWKGTPEIKFLLQNQKLSTLEKTDATPEFEISSNGPSSRITKTTDVTMDFEIVEAGNYVLKWQIQKTTSGSMNEALVGNIRLVRHENDVNGLFNVSVDHQTGNDAIYDIMGRRYQKITRPGLYIINGEKVLVK